MTRMLASISNVHEARRILDTGVDIIDIKDPHKGALGAVETDVVRNIVSVIGGRTQTSATIGDLPPYCASIAEAIAAMGDTGIDIIKVGVFAEDLPVAVLKVIEQSARSGSRIVLVFFADFRPLTINFKALSDAGVYGVMLDTANKTRGSLRTIMRDETLADFVRQAQSGGLLAGLAGSLRQEDIAPLLALQPDYLGFRGALCDRQQRNRTIDINAVRSVRAMIPEQYIQEFNDQQMQVSMH